MNAVASGQQQGGPNPFDGGYAPSGNIDLGPCLGLVADKAQAGRKARQVPEEVVAALKQSGYIRALLPKKWGGLEATPQEFFQASIDIAQQDMGTAWIAGIIAIHAYQLAIMNEQALEDVYKEGPDTCISSSYNPAYGKAEACEGGFKLSGRWGWSSGSAHCSWALLGAIVPEDGYRTFLVPRTDYSIEDTWFAYGLQSTGSNDVVIEQPVFVPEHRTHRQMDGFNCVHSQPNPMYGIPWAQLFIRVVTTPAIGAARHAVALFTGNAAGSSTDPTKLQGDPDIARRVAETINDIEETEAVLFRNLDRLMATVQAGKTPELMDRVRYRYQASLVIDRMGRAVDRLFEVAGGRSVFNDAPIQDIWRDIHIARAHVANSPTAFARNLGAMAMGAENGDFFI